MSSMGLAVVKFFSCVCGGIGFELLAEGVRKKGTTHAHYRITIAMREGTTYDHYRNTVW